MTSLQFELWHECNNGCKMCYLGPKKIRCTPTEQKLASLNEAIEKTKSLKRDIISIIGGEFFQGQLNTPEVHDKFFEFIRLVINKINNDDLKETWVTATLTDKPHPELIEFLTLLRDEWTGKGRVFICTSYDTIGRFHIPQKRINWQDNMKLIKTFDPRINLNTTMILTNDLIENVLANKLNLTNFCTEYQTALMIKHPNPGSYDTLPELEQVLPNFTPERAKTIKFFKKLKLTDPFLFNEKIFDVFLRADECIHHENTGEKQTDYRDKISGNEYSYSDESVNTCGHSFQYQCYKDSDACMMCDYLDVKINF